MSDSRRLHQETKARHKRQSRHARHAAPQHHELELLFHFSREPHLNLLFLALLIGAGLAETAEAINSQQITSNTKTNRDKEKSTRTPVPREIQNICENDEKLVSWNKLPEIRIARNENLHPSLIPNSCATNSASCTREAPKWNEWWENNPTPPRLEDINKIRENVKKQLRAWQEEHSSKLNAIKKELKDKDLENFNKNYLLIFNLKENKIRSQKMGEHLGGYCAEHTAHAAVRLYQHIDKITSIQKISLFADDGDNHVFLIVNGDAKENTLEGKSKVKKYLQGLKNGYICDPWNEGYFVELSKNNNQFYTHNWDKVITEDLSAFFKEIENEAARQFLSNLLNPILEKKYNAAMFFQSKSTEAPSSTEDNTKPPPPRPKKEL